MTNKPLGEILSRVRMDEAVSLDGLTLVPLNADEPLSHLPFYLLTDALQEGLVTVKEVGGGTVPELEVEVQCEDPILALQGMVLQGGKQNRTLNISLLLEPKRSQKIPVSCVERGRWHYRSPNLSLEPDLMDSFMAHMSLRHSISLTAHFAYRETGQVQADQFGVWDEVRRASKRARTVSPTEAIEDVYRKLRWITVEAIKTLEEKGHPLPKQVGVISVVDGKVWGVDLLPTPSVWARVWEAVVRSSLFGMMVKAEGEQGEPDNEGMALDFWGGLLVSEVDIKKSPVGLGEHWLLRPPLEGFALFHEGGLLHLFAFPKETVKG